MDYFNKFHIELSRGSNFEDIFHYLKKIGDFDYYQIKQNRLILENFEYIGTLNSGKYRIYKNELNSYWNLDGDYQDYDNFFFSFSIFYYTQASAYYTQATSNHIIYLSIGDASWASRKMIDKDRVKFMMFLKKKSTENVQVKRIICTLGSMYGSSELFSCIDSKYQKCSERNMGIMHIC